MSEPQTDLLTDAEWSFLCNIPEHDLVDAAIDLDLLIPGTIERRALTAAIVPLVLARARAEGLPLSKYDLDDLEGLPAAHLAAIARLQQLPERAAVRDVLRAGQRVYKTYKKTRPNNPVALLIPTLLGVLGRVASAEP